jgi:DNA-binding response OmpR family regulator
MPVAPSQRPAVEAPGNVLIVDDEAALAEMLRDHLALEGYRVDVAMNGGDAVMLASIERPDAVILDLMLPGISGEQVFEKLRELDTSIAIVLLTGMADETIARGLLKAGAFDYLRKPTDVGRLTTTVALAVAAGREHARPRTVVPFTSDRRLPPGNGDDARAADRERATRARTTS